MSTTRSLSAAISALRPVVAGSVTAICAHADARPTLDATMLASSNRRGVIALLLVLTAAATFAEHPQRPAQCSCPPFGRPEARQFAYSWSRLHCRAAACFVLTT